MNCTQRLVQALILTLGLYDPSRRHEFQCLGPVLLVVPDDMLALWEGEFAFWAGEPSLWTSCKRCARLALLSSASLICPPLRLGNEHVDMTWQPGATPHNAVWCVERVRTCTVSSVRSGAASTPNSSTQRLLRARRQRRLLHRVAGQSGGGPGARAVAAT